MLFRSKILGELHVLKQGQTTVRPLSKFVMDDAKVLPDSVESTLDSLLHRLEQRTGIQFAVLIMPTCAPEDPLDYKTRVFNTWHLGDEDRDDGLLLLIAMEERKIAFETGYGLEGELPDAWLGRAIREQGRPYFQEGVPAVGVLNLTVHVAQHLMARRGLEPLPLT